MFRFSRLLACAAFAFSIANSVQAQISCITVNRVDLIGVSLFDAAEQQAWVASFEGRCVGLGEINSILEAVTLAYVDAGFVTSRAYLPEQNLADGSLEVRVVEGALSGITFNGTSRPNWQAGAFPGLVGTPANLRDIEQGLDQIRSMPTYNAEMEIVAGAEQGQSILEVSAISERPWSVTVSSNNQGSADVDLGEHITSMDIGYDNLMGLNDSWSLNLSKSLRPHPFALDYDGPGTHSVSIGVTVPFGKWSLGANFSWSDYAQTTPGIFAPIAIDGWTQTFKLDASRLLHRDQTSKTHVDFSLERRENANFIADSYIQTSSRVLTVLGVGLRDQRPLWGGQLNTSLGWKQGIKILDAEDYATQLASQPNAQFGLVEFSLQFNRPWQRDHGVLSYSATVKGQWSDDRLYGTQQMSLGGSSSVHGSKSGLVTGNRGILWRNELSYRFGEAISPAFGRATLYAGVDIGRIAPQDEFGIIGGTLSGGVAGLRLNGGWLDVDLSWQEIFSGSANVTIPSGLFLFSVSHKF